MGTDIATVFGSLSRGELVMRRVVKFFMCVLAPSSACFAAPPSSYADMSLPEQRASVELVVPFGVERKSSDHKPRLQLSFGSRLPQSYRLDQKTLQRTEQFRSSKIGFTLDSNPEIYLNGKHFAAAERRSNLSTLAWIGIGAGVLTGAFLVWYDALNDASD